MKKLVMYFDRMEDHHLYKDVGMVPYYLAQTHHLDLEFITADRCRVNEFRGYKIRKIKRFPNFRYNLHFYWHLLRHAKEIDILMTIHCRDYNLILGWFYKRLNPKGVYYIKGDMNHLVVPKINARTQYKPTLKSFHPFRLWVRVKTRKIFSLLKYVDILTVEQERVYKDILANGLGGFDAKNILHHMQNGFDPTDVPVIKPFEARENIILSVGRIGDANKNHMLLIEALTRIDLQDWQVHLVGPVVNDFELYLEDILKKNPELQGKIILTGNISDRQQLYEQYNSAKIFCLTSKGEGYPLVFPEAAYFGNTIITTDVGGAQDITEHGQLGEVVQTNDVEDLCRAIERVISNQDLLRERFEARISHSDELTWVRRIRAVDLFLQLLSSSVN